MEILYERFTPGQEEASYRSFYTNKPIPESETVYARSLLFICPFCGEVWGARRFPSHIYGGDGHAWEVRTVPCDHHGEASLITAWDIIDDFLFIPDDLLIYEARRLLGVESC